MLRYKYTSVFVQSKQIFISKTVETLMVNLWYFDRSFCLFLMVVVLKVCKNSVGCTPSCFHPDLPSPSPSLTFPLLPSPSLSFPHLPHFFSPSLTLNHLPLHSLTFPNFPSSHSPSPSLPFTPQPHPSLCSSFAAVTDMLAAVRQYAVRGNYMFGVWPLERYKQVLRCNSALL